MQQAAASQTSDILIARLQALLGADRVMTDPQDLEFYASDVYSASTPGLAAIRPADIDSLATAVREITAAGCAVVARGGGMSYTGGYAPIRKETVSVDLRDLNRIIEIDEQDMLITVEAGVTWRQIFEALNPLGLRLPFFGTFSGSVATVGGGLSNGALFMGTGRYGTAAETVLGLQVLLADGSLLDTGQAAFRNGRPFYRTFGPDLTGSFLHDSGALGIKTQASLRVIRPPAEVDYLSFVVPDINEAARALSEVARTGAAEEAYVFDPATTRNSLGSLGLGQDLRKLFKVVGSQSGLLKGIKAGAGLVAGGRDFVPEDAYSLHIVCAGRSAAAVAADVAACREVAAQFNAPEIANSIPKAARADPFPPLNGILGPGGTRWAALNAKVRHSDAERIIAATQGLLAPHADAMQENGIHLSQLLIAISNTAFSYEPVFHWHDEWLSVHRRTAEEKFLASLDEPAPHPQARALVHELRAQVVALFAEFGAASNQIGKTYPYGDMLKPRTAALVRDLKAAVDPQGLMNPGALGLDGQSGQ
jgi:D-lactate dehydrogenase (cytochrome)